MKDFASTKARYLRDPLPVRLGGLAADLARIGSISVNPANGRGSRVARRSTTLQLALTLWLQVWEDAQEHAAQRALLAHAATCWSDRVLALSGLMTQPAQP